MKSQRVRLLLAVWLLVVFWSCLIIEAASVKIDTDLSNAVQHISKVIFRQKNGSTISDKVSLESINSFIRIITNSNNFILNNEASNPNKIIYGSSSSWNTILGWEHNIIQGDSENSVIIAWKNNTIDSSIWATIWWWIGNTIHPDSNYSVIAWWIDNNVHWEYSSIPWWKLNTVRWDFSVALWVENDVDWYASAALWSNSRVNANKSFLWTDGSWEDELGDDNVFAVISSKWMVVNATKPHNLAKLTIWSWSLVISTWADVSSCNYITKWVLKTVQSWSSVCLCSCDWNNWSSLYWEWLCNAVCKADSHIVPVCGSLTRVCLGTTGNYYSWSCLTWKAIDWTGAYFVDWTGNVHWSCQTENWSVTWCVVSQSDIINGPCPGNWEYICDFTSVNYDGHVTWTFVPSDNDILSVTLYASESDASGKPCAWWCITWYVPEFNGEDNIWECKPAPCWAQEYSGYYFPAAEDSGYSTGEKTWYINDGTFTCQGTVLCELWSFTGLTQSCDYTCGTWSNEYSGYHYEAPFGDGLTLTWFREYETVSDSGSINNFCERWLQCLSWTINLLDNEVCVNDWRGWISYTTPNYNHTYTLLPKYRGYRGIMYYESVGPCNIIVKCVTGSLITGTDLIGSEWNFGTEYCPEVWGDPWYVDTPWCSWVPTETRTERILSRSNGIAGTWHYMSREDWNKPVGMRICRWTCDGNKGLIYDEGLGTCECAGSDTWNSEIEMCVSHWDCGPTKNTCYGWVEPHDLDDYSNPYYDTWMCWTTTCPLCKDWRPFNSMLPNGGCDTHCHKCAKSWFPYCIPLDFRDSCVE